MSLSPKERIEGLVAIMRSRADVVALKELELTHAKAEFTRVEQESLPDLLRELGMTDVTLLDGTSLLIEETATASITEARREGAHAWLRENGFGGLIQTVVAAIFDVGEEETAREVAEKLAEAAERPATMTERVHPSRLLSFVKERIEAGAAIPYDLFGVHPFSRAKLKAPRARKGRAKK